MKKQMLLTFIAICVLVCIFCIVSNYYNQQNEYMPIYEQNIIFDPDVDLKERSVSCDFENVSVKANITSTDKDGYSFVVDNVSFNEEICSRIFLDNQSIKHDSKYAGYYHDDNGGELWVSKGNLLFYCDDDMKDICEILEFTQETEPENCVTCRADDKKIDVMIDTAKKIMNSIGIPSFYNKINAEIIYFNESNKLSSHSQFSEITDNKLGSSYYQIDFIPIIRGIQTLSHYNLSNCIGDLSNEMVLIRFIFDDFQLKACRIIGCTNIKMVENRAYDLTSDSAIRILKSYFSDIIFNGTINIEEIYPAYQLRYDYANEEYFLDLIWCYNGKVHYFEGENEEILILLSSERK